jgi:hypothetical protein
LLFQGCCTPFVDAEMSANHSCDWKRIVAVTRYLERSAAFAQLEVWCHEPAKRIRPCLQLWPSLPPQRHRCHAGLGEDLRRHQAHLLPVAAHHLAERVAALLLPTLSLTK